MELAIRIQIEELPEGVFLATSDELPGLVAQGCRRRRLPLRHFREVSRLRSFELTHSWNRIGARMSPAISSTPKACWGGFSSSAPEARMRPLAAF
jgi:hypothetical protein